MLLLVLIKSIHRNLHQSCYQEPRELHISLVVESSEAMSSEALTLSGTPTQEGNCLYPSQS